MAPRGKDQGKRKGRSETAEQKASRLKKTSVTKAKKKKEKEAEAAKKAAAERADARDRWKKQLGINNGKDESSNNSNSADDAHGGVSDATTIINNTTTTTTAAAATADIISKNINNQWLTAELKAIGYKSTDETLDTVALRHPELHAALKDRHKALGKVSLTKDLQYICDAVDVPLPLLPFTTKEENQLFAKMMVEHKDGPIDYEKMAVEWCRHVDPKNNIHAKLPCHIRVQATKFDRNARIRTTMGCFDVCVCWYYLVACPLR